MDAARTRAIQYLEMFVDDLEDPFQTALVTYALTVGNSNMRNEAFDKLARMKQRGEPQFYNLLSIPHYVLFNRRAVCFLCPEQICAKL